MPRTRRVDTSGPGIKRVGRSAGFSYHEEDGERITDRATLERIRSLAIPPAWKDVWVCPHPRGHVQATGYDEAGRKQYLYHDDWRANRDRVKFEEMEGFAKALPALRERLDEGMKQRGLVFERVCSCAVRLLDLGLFRIGSERYETENRSYGLTTIRRKHVRIERGMAVFAYPSKSGQRTTHRINNPVVMPTLKALRQRKGGAEHQGFLVYRDCRQWRDLASDEVNAFIKETAGEDFSAKDFRTWTATVLAAVLISRHGEDATTKAERKRAATIAVQETAKHLGNTPAVCRASYIDPRVFDRFDAGETIASAVERMERATDPGEFVERERIERAVLRLIS